MNTDKNDQTKEELEITFRGWQGHFCCPCAWHLNTLVRYVDKKMVISTVGQYVSPDMGRTGYGIEEEVGEDRWCSIGYDYKYETYVYYSDYSEYDVPDWKRQITEFTRHCNDAEAAQQGHYEVIGKVVNLLRGGESNGPYFYKESQKGWDNKVRE